MELAHRIQSAKAHFSHPSHLLGQWQPLGSEWPLLNQYISSCIVTLVFATIAYFTLSTVSYMFFYVWFKKIFTPKEKQLQFQRYKILHDIKWSFYNILGQTPLISLIKLGYPYFSKIQYEFTFTPIFIAYFLMHLIYDQFLTYWIHRLLHHPKIYRYLHSIHHESKAVTPYTGFAFHPLDAFLQAIPVFTSCYFIPIPINLVIGHGLITSLWAISIHDNVNLVPFKGILYAGSHSIHHFPWGQNYNYGKITSICDRLYGTYCDPEKITGYGYESNPSIAQTFNNLNQKLNKLIPDKGLKELSRIRTLYAKKLQ